MLELKATVKTTITIADLVSNNTNMNQKNGAAIPAVAATLKHTRAAGIITITCPAGYYEIERQGMDALQVSTATMYKLATTQVNDPFVNLSSWPFGRVNKAIAYPEYASTNGIDPAATTTTPKREMPDTIESIISREIVTAFNSEIERLKSCLVAATTATMIESYVAFVEQNKPLTIDGILIDTAASNSFAMAEIFNATIEQVRIALTVSKHIVNLVAIGSVLHYEVKDWDALSLKTINSSLKGYGLTSLTGYEVTPANAFNGAYIIGTLSLLQL